MDTPAAELPSSSPLAVSPYDEPFTAMLVGMGFGCFLAGIATLQTFAFFWVHTRDPKGHKIFVLLIWMFAILQITFHVASVWKTVIKQGCSQVILLPWEYRVQIFMLYILAFVTKLFYLLRIWKVAQIRKRPQFLALFLAIFFLLELAFGIVSGYEIFTIKALHLLPFVKLKWADFAAVSLTAFNDIIIAAALVYTAIESNLTWKVLTPLSRTDSTMMMFCIYVLSTGLIPAIFSVIILSAFAIQITSPVFAAVIVMLPQVYTNCFLAMMNARLFFRRFCGDRVFLPGDVEMQDHEFVNMDIHTIRRSVAPRPSVLDIGKPGALKLVVSSMPPLQAL